MPLRPWSIKRVPFLDDASDPGVDTLEFAGPYNAQVPEDTPSRRQIFICRPASGQDEKPCAKKILSTLARRAYRRPVTDADVQPLLSLYEVRRDERDFRGGHRACFGSAAIVPAFPVPHRTRSRDAEAWDRYRVSDLELASRLSFFLWKSIPDDELFDVAARGKLKDPVVLAQASSSPAWRRACDTVDDRFHGAMAARAQCAGNGTGFGAVPDFDDTLREAMIRETELFFESQVREDRKPSRPVARGLHVPQRTAGQALRHRQRLRQHFRRVTLTDPRRQGCWGTRAF